ncbi:MAG: hypothetical protein LKF74_04530 [Megasphaera sp.]|jgi:predicted lipid-binding transport protein (Tim44 family)|nr:hypothetical protein [Megasphaera sp.]MCH4187752.1 hypothetical protein [Megasphaera sp.]MCH4217805.1 hypothetical protein [Megasphaera sp.]
MMKFKKTVVLLAAAALLMVPAVLPAGMTAYAAKGGGGVRMSRPAAPAQKSLPATTQKTTGNTTTKSNDTTNAAKSNAQQQSRTNTTANQNRSSTIGSAMRNIGLFAGGMFLGSMLSNLFGWGGMGFMSDILGILANIAIVLAIVMIVRALWRKFKGKSNQEDDYRKGYEAAMRDQNHDDGQTMHRQEDTFQPIDISNLYRKGDKRNKNQ